MINSIKRILIVEDEFISAEYLKEILLKENYEVIDVVNNGLDAIAQADKLKPDLMLIDIMLMGKMSGCEAAVKIHRKDKKIKFIFLTAYAEGEMIEYAVDANATAYLLKPYREREVLATIKLLFTQEEFPIVDNENIALTDGYRFNIKHHRLFKEKSEVSLSKKAIKLIEILVKNRNISVSNEQICNHVWGEDKNNCTLRSLIHRVRQSISSNLIQNINGLGYKII